MDIYGIIITFLFVGYFFKNRKSDIIYKRVLAKIAIAIAVVIFLVMANEAGNLPQDDSETRSDSTSSQSTLPIMKKPEEIIFKIPCTLGAPQETVNTPADGIVFKSLSQRCEHQVNVFTVADVALSKDNKTLNQVQIKEVIKTVADGQLTSIPNFIKEEGGGIIESSLNSSCHIGQIAASCVLVRHNIQEKLFSYFLVILPTSSGYRSVIVSGTSSAVNNFIRDNAIQK